jgi:hypothetical protein
VVPASIGAVTRSDAAWAGAAVRDGAVGTVADLAAWESVGARADVPALEGRVSEDPAEAIRGEVIQAGAGRVVDGRAEATVIARAS